MTTVPADGDGDRPLNPFEAAMLTGEPLDDTAATDNEPAPEESPKERKARDKKARREQKEQAKALKREFPGLRLTITKPETLFADNPAMPTAEYVRQNPTAEPVTVRATHAQVAAACHGVLAHRVIRRMDGGWMVWSGDQWRDATDTTVNRLISSLISPSDTEPRRIVPYLTRKLTRGDVAALIASGDAVLNGDGVPVHKNDPQRAYTELPYAADDWSGTAASVDGVRRFLAGLVESRAEFDADPALLNCKGTVYELRTDPAEPVRCLGALRPEHMVSLSTAASYAGAIGPTWQTSAWANALAEILPDPETRCYFQKAVGVSLFGGLRAHKMFALVGRGRNGKNKVLEAVGHALGSYARAMQASLIEESTAHPTEMMRLKGARFAYISETASGKKWDGNRCKYLVGDEVMTARAMHRDYESWAASHTLFVATNNLPTLRSPDPAFWVRFDTITCPTRFWIPSDTDEVKAASYGPADEGLPDRLKADAAAILAWAIDGWRMYVADGATLRTPESVSAASREAEAESTPYSVFLSEAVVRGADSDSIPVKDLFTAWQEYIKQNTSFNGANPSQVQQVGDATMRVLPFADYQKRRSGKDVAKVYGVAWTEQGAAWANTAFGPVRAKAGGGAAPSPVTVIHGGGVSVGTSSGVA